MTIPIEHTPKAAEQYPSSSTKLSVETLAPDDVVDLRAQYVLAQGWFDDPDREERDCYDDTYSGTRHIVGRELVGDDVLVSMRLTPVSSLEESLSFAMLPDDDAQCRSDVANGMTERINNFAGASVQLWDLTRLVHRTDSGARGKVLPAFLEMFGMGLGVSTDATASEPWWLFVTTGKMKTLLTRCGIEVDVVCSYDITPNTEVAYFCIVKPVEAMERLGSKEGFAENAREFIGAGLTSYKAVP